MTLTLATHWFKKRQGEPFIHNRYIVIQSSHGWFRKNCSKHVAREGSRRYSQMTTVNRIPRANSDLTKKKTAKNNTNSSNPTEQLTLASEKMASKQKQQREWVINLQWFENDDWPIPMIATMATRGDREPEQKNYQQDCEALSNDVDQEKKSPFTYCKRTSRQRWLSITKT